MESNSANPQMCKKWPRSQPTYKEWKGGTGGDCGRNANPFPAYLQGMESDVHVRVPAVAPGSQPTYKEWKVVNGDQLYYAPDGVPSLPTRNGKKPQTANPQIPQFRSQPTYKEWKVSSRRGGSINMGRSQPTYKEWKALE